MGLFTLIKKRSFVFTLLWCGFILAISFLEAPLKFQAKSLTIPVGVEIGYLVFHALNGIEIVLAAILFLTAAVPPTPPRIRRLILVLAGWLFIQTLLLYGPLDQRTLAIIAGQPVEDSQWHLVYVVMEVVKLGMLFWLAHWQMNEFETEAT